MHSGAELESFINSRAPAAWLRLRVVIVSYNKYILVTTCTSTAAGACESLSIRTMQENDKRAQMKSKLQYIFLSLSLSSTNRDRRAKVPF